MEQLHEMILLYLTSFSMTGKFSAEGDSLSIKLANFFKP
jgi:hypothetical protein